ncbi:MAG: FAD-dependent monooxygenase [Methylophilaceae bacterium]
MGQVEADIVIVGAGLVGLAAAICFVQLGKKVVLVDSKKAPINVPKVKLSNAWDERVYALTPASENWLEALGVWPLVEKARVNEIHAMHIWAEQNNGPLTLSADDANLPKLGCIVENQNLIHALWQQLKTLDIPVIADDACVELAYDENTVQLHLESGACVSTSLLVAADGGQSFVRQQLGIATNTKEFNQTAVVANFLAETSHGNIARQWFAPHNTLALLPLPGRHVSMVWSVSTELATELLKLTTGQLTEHVQAQSEYNLGALKVMSGVASFELKQVTATTMIADRVVLAGDAAHQIHPMAGQGVNLGFRDVIALERLLLRAHHLQDVGEKSFLRQYERARKADIVSMNSLTSGLDDWFASEHTATKKLTDWGWRIINRQAKIKEVLIKQAIA